MLILLLPNHLNAVSQTIEDSLIFRNYFFYQCTAVMHEKLYSYAPLSVLCLVLFTITLSISSTIRFKFHNATTLPNHKVIYSNLRIIIVPIYAWMKIFCSLTFFLYKIRLWRLLSARTTHWWKNCISGNHPLVSVLRTNTYTLLQGFIVVNWRHLAYLCIHLIEICRRYRPLNTNHHVSRHIQDHKYAVLSPPSETPELFLSHIF